MHLPCCFGYFGNAVHVPHQWCGPEVVLDFINDLLCRDWLRVPLHVCNDVLLDLVASTGCVPMLLESWIVCGEKLVVGEACGNCPELLVGVAWGSPIA